MKTYFSVLLTFACSFLSTVSFSQNAQIEGVQFSNETITISTKKTDCISTKNGTAKQYLNITIENKSSDDVQVSFGKELWYDGKCINCNNISTEHQVTVKLSGGSSTSGNCESGKDLKVFVKMLELKNVRQLTDFEFVDIKLAKF